MQDSSGTIFPHIQHACGSFELAATSRLQLARYEVLPPTSSGARTKILAGYAFVGPLAHNSSTGRAGGQVIFFLRKSNLFEFLFLFRLRCGE
jgi:hypothetical protein